VLLSKLLLGLLLFVLLHEEEEDELGELDGLL
jgi:hypothetical protein